MWVHLGTPWIGVHVPTGPIEIVNVSEWRCDALLVQEDKVSSVSLPGLQLRDLMRRRNGLNHATAAETLQHLWDAAAEPILEALAIGPRLEDDSENNRWPHIWWIPTGPLITLPIHAAGYHAAGSHKTVIDRAISSYSSSVKALIYTRRQGSRAPTTAPASSDPGGIPRDEALLVAMAYAPSRPGERPISRLPNAQKEIQDVTDLLSTCFNLEPNMPPKRKAPCLVAIKACRIFHYAGHGHIDPYDPSASALLLEDWQMDLFTVADVRDNNRLQESAPFLAYLSACSTGAALNARLLDENIHLVEDMVCVDIAKDFYMRLAEEGGMEDAAVSRALNWAVRGLRERARCRMMMPDCGDREPASVPDEQEEKEPGSAVEVDIGPALGVLKNGDDGRENRSGEAHEGMKTAVASAPGDACPARGVDTPRALLRHANYLAEEDDDLELMSWAPYVHYGLSV
ncbi:CHAT domain-containing protein [Achaetomium macrosporum]|uniref:CHAT domain-containing protein n=1 Tax=Achaetomium macrosporum TaxID=79813 RepID=A0AAN7C223_9PEZI|nr:CHAT domain-containing protein [Achaetomium macrosporum]